MADDTTRCSRYGSECSEPDLHALPDTERALAEHFLSEVYAGYGERRRASYAPEPVADMVRYDPHFFMCGNAIRDARRLLLAFPDLRLRPDLSSPEATP